LKTLEGFAFGGFEGTTQLGQFKVLLDDVT